MYTKNDIMEYIGKLGIKLADTVLVHFSEWRSNAYIQYLSTAKHY